MKKYIFLLFLISQCGSNILAQDSIILEARFSEFQKRGMRKIHFTIFNNSSSTIFIEKWKIIQGDIAHKDVCRYHYFMMDFLRWNYILFDSLSAIKCDYDVKLSDYWFNLYERKTWFWGLMKKNPPNRKRLLKIPPNSRESFVSYLLLNPEAIVADKVYTLRITYCGCQCTCLGEKEAKLSKVELSVTLPVRFIE